MPYGNDAELSKNLKGVTMSDTITKFDKSFFKMAEQKNQELLRLADGSDTIVKSDENKPILMSKKELREAVSEFAAPLEAKAFEAGRIAGLAEADENRRTRAMLEMAIERGLVADPTKKQEVKKDDKKAADPMEKQVMARKLAEEAKEFVATEGKAGRTVTMAEAVKHVYEKAGVPTR
jgi:hypothetical protein